MNNKKRIIFISVIAVLIAITGLYATYAINVFVDETIPTDNEYDIALDFELSNSIERQVTVEANKTKTFDLDITNRQDGTIRYGVAYTLINLASLPSGVTVAQSSTSKHASTGIIEAGKTHSVSVIIVNNSNTSVTLSFTVINGYKNDSDLTKNQEATGKTIINNVYQIGTSPALITLTNLGLTSYLKNGTPDFTQPATTDEGIYVANDDLGISYYFRGASTNNYVFFAGYYWRIIRINGDGTVRLAYDSQYALENGTFSSLKIIYYESGFKYGNSQNDNTYLGYMYGVPGSTTYTLTHGNKYDNNIKTYLEDTWYATKIKNTTYEQYIADAIYCNNREVSSKVSGYAGGTGIGTKNTAYTSAERLYTNKTPSLICAQPNDRFTYDISNFNVETNGMLDAPIGTITADEVAMAGLVYGKDNKAYYLYSGRSYWTMTPFAIYNSNASAFVVPGERKSTIIFERLATPTTESIQGIKPVISLKADALKKGTGTIGDPFKVE